VPLKGVIDPAVPSLGERGYNRAPLARRPRWHSAPVILGTALATGLLGFVIGGQVRHLSRRGQLAVLSRDPAVQAIFLLEQEQAALRRSVDEARSRLTEGEQSGAAAQRTLSGLRAALERERLAAGLLPVTGQGVLVRLDDSTLRALPPQEDPNNYLIHDYDLRDLVSALWAAGAEALAINDQRVVGTTTVTAVGPTILVNDTRLSPPFEVRAIGNPLLLEDAVAHSPLLAKLQTRVRSYALQLRVAHERELLIPSYRGVITLRYIQKPNSGVVRPPEPAQPTPAIPEPAERPPEAGEDTPPAEQPLPAEQSPPAEQPPVPPEQPGHADADGG
jgi:uncharacterized protein YlxW (UPF0749 family)